MNEESSAASVPFTVTFDQAEPGVWFFTGDLGTSGPFDSLADATDWMLYKAPVAAVNSPTSEDDDLAAKVRERRDYQGGDLLTWDEFWAAVDADDNAP